jgi:hypothetical protein
MSLLSKIINRIFKGSTKRIWVVDPKMDSIKDHQPIPTLYYKPTIYNPPANTAPYSTKIKTKSPKKKPARKKK